MKTWEEHKKQMAADERREWILALAVTAVIFPFIAVLFIFQVRHRNGWYFQVPESKKPRLREASKNGAQRRDRTTDTRIFNQPFPSAKAL